MHRLFRPMNVCTVALVASAIGFIQVYPAGAESGNTGCSQQAAQEPATKPAPDSKDGTSPGNAGSSGWTGGLGGSNIGTAPGGTIAGGTVQPVTAKGLDLAGADRRC